jgi:inorganic pyrophosphatase
MCPCAKVNPSQKLINNVFDLDEHTLSKIKYFFTHYKDLENKTVHVGEYKNKAEAINILSASFLRALKV